MTEEQEKRLGFLETLVPMLENQIKEQAAEIKHLKEIFEDQVKESDERLAELNAARAENDKLRTEAGYKKWVKKLVMEKDAEILRLKKMNHNLQIRTHEEVAVNNDGRKENQRLKEALEKINIIAVHKNAFHYAGEVAKISKTALEGKDETDIQDCINYADMYKSLRKNMTQMLHNCKTVEQFRTALAIAVESND